MASSVSDSRVYDYFRTERAVKLWIEEVLDIKLKDDLQQSLKTGVILCYLCREIDPRSIPRIQEQTEAAFKLKENLQFAVAAFEDLGVPEWRRFLPHDLWNGTNMVAVVESLAELARLAQTKGLPHSLPDTSSLPDSEFKKPSATDMRKLKTLLAKIRTGPIKARRVKVSAAIVRRKLDLLAGSGFDIDKFELDLTKFQALVRGHLARVKYKKLVRDQAYRDHVAKEILNTEKSYVAGLKTCLKVYRQPLLDSLKKKPLISEDDITFIFSDMEVILQFNELLLKDLEERVENEWGPRACLGDLFLKIVGFLKVYTEYLRHYNRAAERLHKIAAKKKPFNLFLENTKANVPEAKDLTLESYLIMPVQRIPRYRMLLTDLCKHTWKDHPDYPALQESSQKVEEIATLLNEKKREAENMQRLIYVAHNISKLKIDLVIPTRRYLCERTLKDEVTALILFNDLLLLAKCGGILSKVSKKGMTYKDHYMLEQVNAKEGPSDTKLCLYKTSAKKPFSTLEFMSSEDAAEVLKAVVDARKDLVGHKKVAKKKARDTALVEEGAENVLHRRTKEKKLLSQQSSASDSEGEVFKLLQLSEELRKKLDQLDDSIAATKNKKKKKKLSEERDQIQDQLNLIQGKMDQGTPTQRRHTVQGTQTISHDLELSEEEHKKAFKKGGKRRMSTNLKKSSGLRRLGGKKSKKSKKGAAAAASAESDTESCASEGSYTPVISHRSSSLSKEAQPQDSPTLTLTSSSSSPSTPTPKPSKDPTPKPSSPPSPSSSSTTSSPSTSTINMSTSTSSPSSSTISSSSAADAQAAAPGTTNDLGKPTHTLEQLKLRPVNIELDKLETYLSLEDFRKLFKMERDAFYQQPKWKQSQAKRHLSIL